MKYVYSPSSASFSKRQDGADNLEFDNDSQSHRLRFAVVY
jgi:hypothetical protein